MKRGVGRVDTAASDPDLVYPAPAASSGFPISAVAGPPIARVCLHAGLWPDFDPRRVPRCAGRICAAVTVVLVLFPATRSLRVLSPESRELRLSYSFSGVIPGYSGVLAATVGRRHSWFQNLAVLDMVADAL